MNPFGLGAIHSVDVRDFKYAMGGAPESLPISYKTDTSMFPVSMQGQRSSCVSHAWVRLLQIYWYKRTGKIIDFSPRFLHAFTAPGMADSDGRDPRVVGNVLVSNGCCTTAVLPNDVTLNDHEYSRVAITSAMLEEAKQYKIPAYAFVNIDQYSIRHAIYHKGAVALLFTVGNEWWTPSWLAKDINPLRAPVIKVGGHEVAGEHWTNNLEGIENSWSDAWNEKGYGEYNIGNYAPAQAICIDDPTVDFNPATLPKFKFMKDLSYGVTDPDVLQLQKRLNESPVTQIAAAGVGSPGHETQYFGTLTRNAMIKYQLAKGITPAFGFCGVKTRTVLNNT